MFCEVVSIGFWTTEKGVCISSVNDNKSATYHAVPLMPCEVVGIRILDWRKHPVH